MPRRLSVRTCLAVAAVGAALLAGSAGAAGNPDSTRDVPIATTAVTREQIEQSGRAIDIMSELNLMRSNPSGLAARMGARPTLRGVTGGDWGETKDFLLHQPSVPKLRYSPALSDIALIHARDLSTTGILSHTGSDGSTLGSRVRQRGIVATMPAEELSTAFTRGASIDPDRMVPGLEHVLRLVLDQGVPGKPHRRDLFNPVFTQVGVGCASHRKLGDICVINLSNDFMLPAPPISLPPNTPGFRFTCPPGSAPAEVDAWRQRFLDDLSGPIIPDSALEPLRLPTPARESPKFAGFSIANEIAYRSLKDPSFMVDTRLNVPRSLGLGFGYCSADYIRGEDDE